MDIEAIWLIVGVVGIVVFLVIIGQAIALCYFRRKARSERGMDKLTRRKRFDRCDQARYSAPPCRKDSKSNARAHADTDSHIYEMVGVNALYNGSHELNKDNADNTIKDRPPLPLPLEPPEPVQTETLSRRKPLVSMASTLSLISNSSGTLKGKRKMEPPGLGVKKAPARPPKQIDDDIPGSLKRAPKVAPPVAAKAGSIPKMPASDPALIELKNAFKKRNIANDSPSLSPTRTLDRKEPPKIQAKPTKKQSKQEIEAKKQPKAPPCGTKPFAPPGGINPLAPPGGINLLAPPGSQPSQLKLILPKIEAGLKHNLHKNVPVPKSSQDLTPPEVRPNVLKGKTQMDPVTPVSQQNRQPHVPYMAPAQTPVPHMSPALQNRPLPTPHQPMTSRQAEDARLDTGGGDDDDEWGYEELGKYNLYNV